MEKFRVEFNLLSAAHEFVEAFEERNQGVNYPSRIASHNGEYPVSWSEEGSGAWCVYIEAAPVRVVTKAHLNELNEAIKQENS